jgi:hypothetical protein
MGPDVIKAVEFDLSGMLVGIKAEAEARGARRIVFDAVDALLSLLDDPLAERREISRLTTGSPRHKRREVVLARAELGARIEALEQELKQKQVEAERSIDAEARRKPDLAKRRKVHSPSAKIFKKRPDNSQGAGKKTPGRRSPKGGGQ